MPGRRWCVHPAGLRWSLPRQAGWRCGFKHSCLHSHLENLTPVGICVLVYPEAVQKHLLSGNAGLRTWAWQRLRYAADAGILVDGLDGSPAGVGHVSYGFFGPRWACQASTLSSLEALAHHTPQSTLVR